MVGTIHPFQRGLELTEQERYRQLAAEARANAAHASDAYDKRTLLLVAQRYEVLAERAKIRAHEQKDDVA